MTDRMHVLQCGRAAGRLEGPLLLALLPLVQDAGSLSEAALVLNRDIWSIWGIVFQANQTPDIMSPFQVKNSCCLLSARPKERQTSTCNQLCLLAGHQGGACILHWTEHLPG